MAIFYSVATLVEPSDGYFYAVLRIDTEKFVGDGCEGTVVSLHATYPEAEASAALGPAGYDASDPALQGQLQ
jgi:hypothetical protein